MLMPTHIVAVGGIVENERDEILLVKGAAAGFFQVGRWKPERI